MVSITNRAFGRGSSWSLAMAFVERQTNLWKRYWAWELVWLVYGVVNTVAITLIADQAGAVSGQDVSKFVLFLRSARSFGRTCRQCSTTSASSCNGSVGRGRSSTR